MRNLTTTSISTTSRQTRRANTFAILFALLTSGPSGAHAAQIDVFGPQGSVAFGTTVTVLPNGNIVVTDPQASIPFPTAGAVHLYSPSGSLISTLRGGSANDRVGIGGVTVLANGNYVIRSRFWSNGTEASAGAVTWGHRDVGVSGTVSPANSLVGSKANDNVGLYFITVLTNGNFVVLQPEWDNGVVVDAGAVTWINGATGLSGPVSAANSLVGTRFEDFVGRGESSAAGRVGDGNFVIVSPLWDSGAVVDAGAVTWLDGNVGIVGTISTLNSLVGSTAYDLIGNWRVTALANGHYVVASSDWDNGTVADVGAVTWGDGNAGVVGAVGPGNSLIGASASDSVGYSGVTALTDGHYVASAPAWDSAAMTNVGAIAWADGTRTTSAAVSANNSLTGSSTEDYIGSGYIWPVANGNYVVVSPFWNSGAVADAGAATLVRGGAPFSGTVTATNSLVGSSYLDLHEASVVPLSNGHYIVATHRWDNGAFTDAGAVTWRSSGDAGGAVIGPEVSLAGDQSLMGLGFGVQEVGDSNYIAPVSGWSQPGAQYTGAVVWADGEAGIRGFVSTSNALHGTLPSDASSWRVFKLASGNFVVGWPGWGADDRGAATWVDGNIGMTGAVSPQNSVVGGSAGDRVGAPLGAVRSGGYVVMTPSWDDGALANVGMVSRLDDSTPTSGVVRRENSLTGTQTDDFVGSGGAVTIHGFDTYVIRSPNKDLGVNADVGAVTVLRDSGPLPAIVDSENSVIGSVAGEGPSMVFDFSHARGLLAVGRRTLNRVSVLSVSNEIVFASSFD